MNDYKYLNPEKINKRIEEQEAAGELVDKHPNETAEDVLFGTLFELCQLAEDQGLTEDEVDSALRRVLDARADRLRSRFRLHTND